MPPATSAYNFHVVTAGDAVLSSVFLGNCGNLFELDCGSAAAMTIPLMTAGATYYVRVGDWTADDVIDLQISAVVPPANDDCATAAPLALGTNSVSALGADYDPSVGPCDNDDQNTWYSFVPATTGAYRFVLSNTNSVEIEAVYTGSCGALIPLSCGGQGSFLFPTMTAGVTYYVEISDWQQLGAVDLDITAEPSPALPGDSCTTALVASVGANPADMTGAINYADGGCNSFDPNFWFAFTPVFSGPYAFIAYPQGDNEVAAIYAGSCQNPTAVTCVGESQASLPSLTAGVTYYVEVSMWNGTGPMTLDVLPLFPQVNDECAAAIPLALGTSATFTNTDATTSPYVACADIGSDLWFTFTAPCGGAFSFSTCGLATFDTVMALYSACGDLIACDDDSCANDASTVAAALNAGDSVLLRVGGYNGRVGSTAIHVGFAGGISLSFQTAPGSVAMSIKGGTPDAAYFAPLTAFAGNYPQGAFFGIDISFLDLFLQASAGPPFLGQLDGCGAVTQGPYLGVPPGLTFYSVALDDLAAPVLRASIPTSFTTL